MGRGGEEGAHTNLVSSILFGTYWVVCVGFKNCIDVLHFSTRNGTERSTKGLFPFLILVTPQGGMERPRWDSWQKLAQGQSGKMGT